MPSIVPSQHPIPGEKPEGAVLKRRIVLLGPPASGKGTQAERIQATYGLQATSTGAMLREEARSGSELGRIAARHTDRGELVPDALILELVQEWLETHNGAFVFDGFPRTLGQGEALEQLLEARGTPLEVVFFFDTPLEVIRDRVLNRVTCGNCGHIFRVGLQVSLVSDPCPDCQGPLIRRDDDTEAVLAGRLAEYREKTEPLIAFYRERGLLVQIKAEESPENVFAQVRSALEAAV